MHFFLFVHRSERLAISFMLRTFADLSLSLSLRSSLHPSGLLDPLVSCVPVRGSFYLSRQALDEPARTKLRDGEKARRAGKNGDRGAAAGYLARGSGEGGRNRDGRKSRAGEKESKKTRQRVLQTAKVSAADGRKVNRETGRGGTGGRRCVEAAWRDEKGREEVGVERGWRQGQRKRTRGLARASSVRQVRMVCIELAVAVCSPFAVVVEARVVADVSFVVVETRARGVETAGLVVVTIGPSSTTARA